MNLKNKILKQVIALSLGLFTYIAQSQEAPTFKYFEKNTIDEVKIDFDNDGDLDYIVAGVISDKNQGRVYLVENKGTKLGKPEYIYSFPTIPIKQHLEIHQDDNITTITIFGTSPTGEKTKFVAILNKGVFEGLILQPATYKSQK